MKGTLISEAMKTSKRDHYKAVTREIWLEMNLMKTKRRSNLDNIYSSQQGFGRSGGMWNENGDKILLIQLAIGAQDATGSHHYSMSCMTARCQPMKTPIFLTGSEYLAKSKVGSLS